MDPSSDVMEVDTPSMTTSTSISFTPPSDLTDPHAVLLSLFSLCVPPLRAFIARHIVRALGHDYLSVYLPSPNASFFMLLRFILDKWISVFDDSSLSSHKHLITQMARNVKMITSPSGDILAASSVEATRICVSSEKLMYLIGNSALSTHISTLHPPLATRPKQQPPQVMDTTSKQLIVLDGSNIAWRHGYQSFSLTGSWLAYKYFRDNHHPVVLFLPDPRLQDPHAPCYHQINPLRGTPNLVLTPGTDYDDAYLCHHARKHRAVVVSNDKFEDVIYQACADGTDREWRSWLRACRLSFTFQHDSFLPNPSFHWQRASDTAARLVLK